MRHARRIYLVIIATPFACALSAALGRVLALCLRP